MTPKAFDLSIIALVAILTAAGIVADNFLFHLASLEAVAVLFGVAYLTPNYSILTEFSYSFVTVLFFPRTKHWLWILCLAITGAVLFEAVQINHAT